MRGLPAGGPVFQDGDDSRWGSPVGCESVCRAMMSGPFLTRYGNMLGAAAGGDFRQMDGNSVLDGLGGMVCSDSRGIDLFGCDILGRW